MPIPSENSRVQYAGNGSTVTPYVVSFYFLANADVKVVLTSSAGVESTLVETTDYVLTGAGVAGGGSVVTVAAHASTATITIYREPAVTQLTEFVGTGPLTADVLTRGLDKLTMLVQTLHRKVLRTLRVSDASDELTGQIGGALQNKIAGFGSDKALKLYTSAQLLEFLNIPGSVASAPTATWSDATNRALKVPDFVGQIGVQTDDNSVWISTATTAGSWVAISNPAAVFAATQRVRGRNTAGAGAAEEVTATQVLDWIASTEGSVLTRGASAWGGAFSMVGQVASFATIATPAGWLKCDGTAVSRTTYANLFSKLVFSSTVTITIATPAVVNWTAHGLSAYDTIKFSTTGALPTGLVAGTEYFVGATGLAADSFRVTATAGGADINTSGTQSGVHTCVSAPHGAGDGSTTFNTPDARGEFIRGFDDGRGIDTARTFGSAQDDAFESHTHTQALDIITGTLTISGSQFGSNTGAQTGATGGTETRPRNKAYRFYIKF